MHITSCPECGKAYEEQSEESANSPSRRCPQCLYAYQCKCEDAFLEHAGFVKNKKYLCRDCGVEIDREGSCNCGTL